MGKNIDVDISGYEKLLLQLQSQAEAGEVAAAIVIDDPEAAKYYPVVEFGSTPDAKPWPAPGPKTRRGSGGRQGRIMSKQAPAGFVFRWTNKFIGFLKDAYLRRLSAAGRPLYRAEIAEAANEAADKAMELIQAGVPIDSGRLKGSIKIERAR